LHNCMKKIDKKTHLFTKEYLTFHLGSDRTWAKDKKNVLWLKNNGQAAHIRKRLSQP